MRKPTVSPLLLASLVSVGLVAVGLVALARSPGLGPSEPPLTSSSQPSLGPEATPVPSNLVTIDPATCALDRQPGPDETPVRGIDGGADGGGGDSQGFDPVDWGTGRWRLCLTTPVAIQLEGSAWCQWSDRRDAVIGLEGLDVRDGAGVFRSWASIPRGSISVARFEDTQATLWAADVDQPIDPGPDGRAGASTISLRFIPPDPATLPSGATPAPAPGKATGTIRWSCGEPPARRPGRADGELSLHLDAPINTDWIVPVTCSWAAGAGGARVEEVIAEGLGLGERTLTVRIGPNDQVPDYVEASVTVWGEGGFGTYASDGSLIVYRQSPDAASGLVRLRALHLQPDGQIALGPEIDEVSGTASWRCDPPATAGPVRDDGNPANLRIVAGVATITFSPAVIEPIRGPVSCQLSEGDPQEAGWDRIDGTIPVGTSSVLLRIADGRLRLALADARGMPAGEYDGGLGEVSRDLLAGDLGARADVTWGPLDARYVPLGGPIAPRTLTVDVDLTCDIRAAQIPGLTFGQIELSLASGIDRSWTVTAACSWLLRKDGPVAARITSLDPLEVGAQLVRIVAGPEPQLVVIGREAIFQRKNASVIDAQIAPDRSTGRVTFQGLGERGQAGSARRGLGGPGGPLLVDGSLNWTCGPPPAGVPPDPAGG